MNLKKLESYLLVNLLGPGPRLIKKNLPDRGLTKVEKHCFRLIFEFLCTVQLFVDIWTVWRSTCSSNYLKLQAIQSKRLRVIGNHTRRTPTSYLHNILTLILLTWRIWWAPNNASRWQMGFNSAFNIEPIRVIIHRLTAKFFAHCPVMYRKRRKN